MTIDATNVGELVQSQAARRTRGRVKRIFRNSAYLESASGLVLLLRGQLRSPMTVNLVAGTHLQQVLSVGERFELEPAKLGVGELEIGLSNASVFRSGLVGTRKIRVMSEERIVKSATALKLLYSASESAFDLVKGQAFDGLVGSLLRPLSSGRLSPAYRLQTYQGIIGSGTGFTPAGDDIIAGFTASFNLYARSTGKKQISLPVAELKRRTVPESALLVDYAQRGYVDETLQGLILAGLGGRPSVFRAHLSELASRGHTSGLDMSLGVLLMLACASDIARRGSALESFLMELRD